LLYFYHYQYFSFKFIIQKVSSTFIQLAADFTAVVLLAFESAVTGPAVDESSPFYTSAASVSVFDFAATGSAVDGSFPTVPGTAYVSVDTTAEVLAGVTIGTAADLVVTFDSVV